MNIKQSMNYLFNWKQFPASVFFFVVPLAFIGFGSMFSIAYIHMKFNADPWYMVIFGVAMAVFVAAIWRIRKPLMQALED